MNGPLVSIIVPVYNGERFLGAALESIFAQDYHPFEVIVVDDGSTDATLDIARSFAGVQCFQQVNQGPAAARNAGMAIAHGDFLAFHDCDDLMDPHKLSIQMTYLLTHPETGYVLGRQAVFFEPGIEPPPWLKRDRVFGDLGGVQPQSGIVRRTVLERIGGFDPSFRTVEGMDWLFRMRAAGVEIAVIPEIVLHRRIHSGNWPTKDPTMGQTMLRSLKGKIDRERAQRLVQPQKR